MRIKSAKNKDSKKQQEFALLLLKKSTQGTFDQNTQSPKKLKLKNGGKSEIAKRRKSYPKTGSTTIGICKSPEKYPEVHGNIIEEEGQIKKNIEIEARQPIHTSNENTKDSFGMNCLFTPSTIDSTLTECSDDEDADDDEKTPVSIAGNYITINKTAIKKAFELLSAQKASKTTDKAARQKVKFRRTCNEGYSHMYDVVHWESYAYVVRAIRNLILERDWQHLKELLRLMLKQATILKNYVKEITYLYFLINADSIEPAAIEDYFLLCFSSYDGTKKSMREFDIWFKNHEFI